MGLRLMTDHPFVDAPGYLIVRIWLNVISLQHSTPSRSEVGHQPVALAFLTRERRGQHGLVDPRFDRLLDDPPQHVRRDGLGLHSVAFKTAPIGRFRRSGRQIQLGNLRRSYGKPWSGSWIKGPRGSLVTRSLRRIFRDWCNEAGFPAIYHPHVARRQMDAEVPIEDAMTVTGHKDRRVLLHYAKKRDERKANERANAKYAAAYSKAW